MAAKLSVLIVSYNTCALTLECLRSIYLQAIAPDLKVIVVDNASDDGSTNAISTQYPQVELIALRENIGFAAANNLGSKSAVGDYLLLLNPDTVVLDGAIARLYEFAQCNNSAQIFGGRTLSADGSVSPESCWGKPTPWSMFCQATGLSMLGRRTNFLNPEALGGWARNSVREVDIVSGCFLLISLDFWCRLGGFDKDFFMYGEDADLCLRARSLGARCLICPEATIVHYAGASDRIRADKMTRLFTAKRKLLEKHWRKGTRWFGDFSLQLWAISRLTAFGFISSITGRYAESYHAWKTVWARRSQWTSISHR